MALLRTTLLTAAALMATLAAQPAFAEAHTEMATDTAVMQSEGERLNALFADADRRELELNPLARLFRGDDSDADSLGDYLTDASFYAGRLDTQLNMALLAQIDREQLNATDRLA